MLTNVILSAQREELSITLPGYAFRISADVLTEGTFTLPFFIWEGLLLRLENIPDSEIIMVVEENSITLDRFTIRNQYITPADSSASFMVFNNYDKFKNTGIIPEIKDILSEMKTRLLQAGLTLREYDITPEDLAWLMENKLRLKHRDKFLQFLFENSLNFSH